MVNRSKRPPGYAHYRIASAPPRTARRNILRSIPLPDLLYRGLLCRGFWLAHRGVAEGEMTAGVLAAFFLLLGQFWPGTAIIRDCGFLPAGDGQR